MITIANSQRLKYALIQDDEAELLYELEKDPDVMHFINGGQTVTLDEVIKHSIPRLQAYRDSQKGWGLWKVSKTDNGEYLGWVLIRPENFFNQHHTDESNLEIGWRFKQSSWGHGYATESAQAIMDGIYQQTNVNRFHAIAVKSNLASIKIMTKLGMTFKKEYLHQDKLGDSMAVYYEKSLARMKCH
jgi:RimJ/RimL family protein N-acetyltransferase